MSRERTVKLTLGFKGDRKIVELNLPDDEPTPWDLNSKLDVVGHEHPRVDAVAKVTGTAKYTHDVNFPDLLFAGFARSKHARANLGAIDTDAAEKHPGVKAVLRMSQRQRAVRYAGEPLVAIAAESRQALEEAIDLVKVEYEPLPHVVTTAEAMKDDAPQVHSNRPNVSRGQGRPMTDQTEEAMKNAAHVVEARCTTQVQTHSCLETHGVVAKWDGDNLTLWASTQATFGVRRQLAQQMSVSESQVTVITEFMGGGFGSKFSAGYWGGAAAQLARQTGRPVKLMLDRREEQTDTGNRPDSIQTMKLAVTSDGKLGAYQVDIAGTPGIGRGAGAANPMIYDFPRDLLALGQSEVATNAGGQQAFRAPGHPQGSFALETIMNLAAEAAGIDPLAFRMRNNSSAIRHAQFVEGARRILWRTRLANGTQKGRYRRGLGVAGSRWGGMGGPQAEVLCRILRDGSVQVRNGAQDIGTGTRTIMGIVAAEELGLSLADVQTFMGNTNDPIGPGSGGSTTAPSLMPAARQAAFLAGRALRELVAQFFECSADDLILRKGRVSNPKNGQSLAFRQACKLIKNDEIAEVGKRRRNYASYEQGVAGVQFADVTVDCDYGLVTVNKVVALQDAGMIVNAKSAESQMLGGVIQGVSYALFEERHMDRHKGFMMNADLEAYKIAGPGDMPEIDVVLYSVANGGNNTSVAGIGEPANVPTAAAIAGAVWNALGTYVPSLPMTPDRVLAALEASEK